MPLTDPFRESSASPRHDPRTMKRMILMMAATASVLAAMPTAAPAFARDGDQGRRGERSEGRGRGQERGAERREERRADDPPRVRREDDRRPREAADRPRGDDRRRYDEEARPNYMQGPRPNYMRPAPGSGRRGYLPDRGRSDVVDDYHRYRLRPPPQGYAWVRMGNGFALVEMGSGRIFDRVD
jgi:Ni/Co efflux regulator RcnB